MFSAESFSVSARIAQACYGPWFYLIKTVRPRNLIAAYPLPRGIDWRTPPFCLSILGTLAMSAGLYLVRRRWPGLLAAWLCYLVILAPSSGIVRTTDQIAADRYSYLAMLGAVIVVAAGFCRIMRFLSWHRRGAVRNLAVAILSLTLPALLVLIVMSRNQCQTWRDTRTLWTHALAHSVGSNAVAHYNMGHYLLERGDIASAVDHFAEAHAA